MPFAVVIDEISNYMKFFNGIDISIYDLEQILIHEQYYLDRDIIEIYNKKIFSNRDMDESIINFDINEIKRGNLVECYNRSYCRPLFKQLLRENKELKHLEKLIN